MNVAGARVRAGPVSASPQERGGSETSRDGSRVYTDDATRAARGGRTMKAVSLRRLALLLLCVGAGLAPAAVARTRSGGKAPPPARDSVLRIPRVSQPPDLDPLLEARPSPSAAQSARASRK